MPDLLRHQTGMMLLVWALLLLTELHGGHFSADERELAGVTTRIPE